MADHRTLNLVGGDAVGAAVTPSREHGRMAIDPICGMKVDPHTATLKADHAGRTYYFCSPSCRTNFVANPLKYLHAEQAKAPARPVLQFAVK